MTGIHDSIKIYEVGITNNTHKTQMKKEQTITHEEAAKLTLIAYKAGKATYTPLKKFYAWYGFASIILHTIALVSFLTWAHRFINANL